jgi:glyoxylase-like metal-dependent hydrolase (beta-lactamase superfamily II)
MTATTTIDCHYMRPQFAAAYLLVEGDEAAFVEANTTLALPHLLGALSAAGRQPEDVRWIMVTHVHLDHAGGASALMTACPNATLLCHPRASRHLVDPTRLVSSARAVYGEEAFEGLYGQIEAINATRVRVMSDEETLSWGQRKLTFLHTRGHANHHFCVHDSSTAGVFTGDAFGLCYPALQSKGLMVFPSTSPTGFHAEEARKSVRRIQDRAGHVLLTHFGRVDAVNQAAVQLLDHLDFAEALLKEAAASDHPDEELAAFCAPRVKARFEQEVASMGLHLDAAGWSTLALDMDLNGQGIAWAARNMRAGRYFS